MIPSILAALVISIIGLNPFADTAPTSMNPPLPSLACEAPPQGASELVASCFDLWCTIYLKKINQCNGDRDCINLESAKYHIELGLCLTRESKETSDDLVIWLDGAEWKIAWPGTEFIAGAEKFSFNM